MVHAIKGFIQIVAQILKLDGCKSIWGDKQG